ncbi:hypothetical protein PIB30_091624, partial [Stylosanthes scabra]|nr:hypothetical protein [Stylosanthes scabra]
MPKFCRATSSDRWLRLENNQNGELQYSGGLVNEIKGVNVNKCNMSFVEAAFLGLGYNRYNEIYWLKPGFDLRNGLRLLRNDYDSLRMRESALRNQRRVDLYCEHEVIAIDAGGKTNSGESNNQQDELPQNESEHE